MKNISRITVWLSICVSAFAILLFALLYIFYEYHMQAKVTFSGVLASSDLLFEQSKEQQENYQELYQQLSVAQKKTVDLNERVRNLRREQDEAEEDLVALTDDLEASQENFEKLQEIDRELLQKYSKVYFLNENYVPSSLADIDPEYLRDDKQLQFHGDAIDQLHTLMKRARNQDIDITIASAYRSFEYQQQIKSQFVQQYGSGANTFSADQGYSEHQLGTTVDFSTQSLGGAVTSRFDQTEAFNWLQDNAHRYGFVMSYPPGNAFYQYEPWHWRFVGEELARDLDRSDEFFYDWDQRRINEYLFEIFKD